MQNNGSKIINMNLTLDEIYVIRVALQEFRVHIPDTIKVDEKRLEHWLDVRACYSADRFSAENKMTDVIVAEFDAKHQVSKG